MPKAIDPCILVILGATGDLTARKLAPAIYNLGVDGLLPKQFACVGFARRQKSHEEFRKEFRENITSFSRTQPIDETLWKEFQEQLFYHCSEFDEEAGYESLKIFLDQLDQKFGTRGNRIFYLSVQPKFFPLIIEKLHTAKLVYDIHQTHDRWSRVIIEKPFGHDTASAAALQDEIEKYLDESQVYRIDHYLGKETVQNLLVFRFANAIFESFWNYKYIDHVQITVAEDIGIGTRGHFFEEQGLLRDIVQNHMMQLLSLVAMEPPISLAANAIRDEKVKILQAIRPLEPREVVRGQYGPGTVRNENVVGYRQEADVDPNSGVETYVALKVFIDNWRWSGIPFYLRGGKRLPKRASEIAVIFKDAPRVLFQQQGKLDSNLLAIRIQPNEGIALKINCKVPGPSSPIQPVKMDFRYDSYFGRSPPEAYERLIWDCMLGDSTLFARCDEVYHSWKIFTPVLEHWASTTSFDFPNYTSGTWGPQAAYELIAKEGRTWREL